MLNAKIITVGVNLEPKTTTTADSKGDLEVIASTGKLDYHNGTTVSPVVTEAHTATLTNKTFNANGTGNSLSNVETADLAAGVLITSTTLVGASNTNFPSTTAIKTYADAVGTTAASALATEASTRATADTTLQTNITAEASTRATADTTLQTNITTEASTRATADTTLQTNIGIETSARTSADTTLQTNLTNHTSASTNVHGVTSGSIMGTTETQTVTSKTMVVAANVFTTAASGNLVATELNAALAELQADIDTRALNASSQVSNLGIAATVAANALTIALKTGAGNNASSTDKVTVGFRSVTATTGQYTLVDVTGALSTVISSGSTAGQVSGSAGYIYVYLINNAGTAELAWSRSLFDEGSVKSTTAEGGAGGADSSSIMYSTTARTNVPFRLVGRILNTQTVAGTWDVAPTEISILPFEQYLAHASYRKSAQNMVNGAATIVTFDDQVVDNYKAMNTTTGEYTIPNAGVYQIIFRATLNNSTTWAIGEQLETRIYVDGVERSTSIYALPATCASSITVAAPTVFYTARFTAGQVITGRLRQDSGGDIALVTGNAYTNISISQLSK